mgnify:CR=1 FL=1
MKHLTEEQRYTICVMWQNNLSKVQIADAIEVHKSTIRREPQRNKDEKKSGIYDWALTQKRSNDRQQTRARYHRMTEKIQEAILRQWS